MKYNLKVGSQGHIYLPKIVREALGKKLVLLPDAEAGVIYPEGANLGRVIRSLEIIITDLELRASKPGRAEVSPSG